jgi:hypothetical protein
LYYHHHHLLIRRERSGISPRSSVITIPFWNLVMELPLVLLFLILHQVTYPKNILFFIFITSAQKLSKCEDSRNKNSDCLNLGFSFVKKA